MFVPCAVLLALLATTAHSARTWNCEDGKCVKTKGQDPTEAISVEECKVTCLQYAGLWPKPTGDVTIGDILVTINPEAIKFHNINLNARSETILLKMEARFFEELERRQKVRPAESLNDTVYRVNITTQVEDPDVTVFTEGADESYELTITPPETAADMVQVRVTAKNILGVRHGLVTFTQLIAFDDIRGRYRLLQEATITDKPVFTHRGVLLDTVRDYMTPDTIKRMITYMGLNKLNTFHWHITDVQSFPYVSRAYPQLSEEGAYSTWEVYTPETIQDIIDWATSFGVRVLPEFDSPAHVGSGWHELDSNMVACFRKEPWTKYCPGPPCGQLDPTYENIYPILGTLFKEFVELFQSDLFHMGGDEVNMDCWRSTPRIMAWMAANNYTTDDEGFVRLWGMYQEKALAALRQARHGGKAILWSSTLTDEDHVTKYLNPADYIIQIWTVKTDNIIKYLLSNNFSLVLSNHDELYFDCGGPAWIGGPGQNWCSPYIGWQAVYDHSPYKILENLGLVITEDIKKHILGSEAALWASQLHDSTAHGRMWPRAAALAERLWSDPAEGWAAAQYRMNHQKERLGAGEQLQPKWCYQNDGYCGLGV